MNSKPQLFETVQTEKSPKENVRFLQRKTFKWTQEEDKQLLELIAIYGKKNWKKIAEMMKRRNAVQCLHRWSKILRPGLVKGPWRVEEDKTLIDWVSKQGPMKWSSCSELIPGRSGKQCRERWYNNLDPKVVKGNWTANEEYKIFKLFESEGSQWSKIASYFRGRTENSIKNRFYCTLRRISSKYSGTDTSNSNLDELLSYFQIALKEKEIEMKREINTNKNNCYLHSPYINATSNIENDINEYLPSDEDRTTFNNEFNSNTIQQEQTKSGVPSYISNITNHQSTAHNNNNNNNDILQDNNFQINNFQQYYLTILMNLCIQRNNYLINYFIQQIIIKCYYNQLLYLLLQYHNFTCSQ